MIIDDVHILPDIFQLKKVWWWLTWQPDPILQKPQISYQVIIETLVFGISLYLLLIHRPWPFWDLPNNNDTKSSYENLLPWMILEWFAVVLMKKKNINCCFNEKMNFWISDVLSNYLRKGITYGRIIAEELMQMQNFNFRCWHDIIFAWITQAYCSQILDDPFSTQMELVNFIMIILLMDAKKLIYMVWI